MPASSHTDTGELRSCARGRALFCGMKVPSAEKAKVAAMRPMALGKEDKSFRTRRLRVGWLIEDSFNCVELYETYQTDGKA